MSEDISSSIKMPLSGWSGYIEEPSEIRLINKESIQRLITNSNEKFIARGHGCSFGDQAILNSGIVLDTNNLKEIKWINDEIISVESGGVKRASSELLPRNKTLVGIPGGLQITIGVLYQTIYMAKIIGKTVTFLQT